MKSLKSWISNVIRMNKPALSKNSMQIFDENPSEGTHYQDDFDRERMAALRPYCVEDSGIAITEIESNININFYLAYGPDFTNKTPAHISVDGPLHYERFIKELSEIEDVRIETFANNLPNVPLAAGERRCLIRHDVDGDLVAARQQAKIEAKYGAQTSFFLLHTAPYYGHFDSNKIFQRNTASLQAYKEIQEYGHELALHTDGMHVYQEYKIDGASAITREINWLRKNGCNLVGTTAHNSASIYGCENYSIFQGKIKGNVPDKKGVFHNGRWAPMQVLDEDELNLTYEANELLWQTHTPVLYCALRSQNEWRVDFLNFSDEILDCDTRIGSLRQYKNKFVSAVEVLNLIKIVPTPVFIYIVVHPMHYGMRANEQSQPWLPEKAGNSALDGKNLCAYADATGALTESAVTVPNEFDLPDRGLDCFNSSSLKVFFLGDENIATPCIAADSKCTQVLARRLGRELRRTVGALAYLGDDRSEQGLNESVTGAITDASLLVFVLTPKLIGSQLFSSLCEDHSNNQKLLVFIYDSGVSGAPDPSTITELERKYKIQISDVEQWFAESAFDEPKRIQGSHLWSPFGHYIVAQKLTVYCSGLLSGENNAPAGDINPLSKAGE